MFIFNIVMFIIKILLIVKIIKCEGIKNKIINEKGFLNYIIILKFLSKS